MTCGLALRVVGGPRSVAAGEVATLERRMERSSSRNEFRRSDLCISNSGARNKHLPTASREAAKSPGSRDLGRAKPGPWSPLPGTCGKMGKQQLLILLLI